ncbi:hypothetical protein DsansV1_C30g0214941 [Dioscorea sansibarensis]
MFVHHVEFFSVFKFERERLKLFHVTLFLAFHGVLMLIFDIFMLFFMG